MKVNPTQQDVIERAKTLPEAMKEAYFSEDSSLSIGRVAGKNSLDIDEGRILADLVGLVLLDYVRLQDFVPELINRLSVDKDKAERIYHDVYSEIFSSLKQFLLSKEKQYEKKEDTTTQNKEVQRTDAGMGEIKQLLRNNSKTISLKDIITNIK